MIKVFRKIRQNLLAEGKTGKYLKYAVGEIVLVVIGILIALQLNAWKEEIQAKEELKASMDSMLDDLAQDIEFYNAEIERIGKRVILLNDFPSENPRTQTRNVPYTKPLGNIWKKQSLYLPLALVT